MIGLLYTTRLAVGVIKSFNSPKISTIENSLLNSYMCLLRIGGKINEKVINTLSEILNMKFMFLC